MRCPICNAELIEQECLVGTRFFVGECLDEDLGEFETCDPDITKFECNNPSPKHCHIWYFSQK